MNRFKRIWMTKVLTIVLLFSASALGSTSALYEMQYDVPNTQSKFFVRVDANENDVVFSREKNEEWKVVFNGKLTEIFVPPGATITGTLPDRVVSKSETANTKYIQFVSEFKFHVLVSGYGYAQGFSKPGGRLQSSTWKIGLKHLNEIYDLASLKTEQGATTWIHRRSDKQAVIVNHTFQKFTPDYSISGGVLDFGFPEKIDLANLRIIQSAPVSAVYRGEPTKINERLRAVSDSVKASNVPVKDGAGADADAWKIVQEFATDLTDDLKEYQELDEATRTRVEQIFRNLVKREVGSAKILGSAGTGKTHLIKMMVAELNAGKGPAALQDTMYLQVDPAALTAGTRFVGSTDTKINAMIALSKKFKIVWILDEAHVLRGAGTHSNNSNDVFQMLKPGLTEGFIRIVAMSTDHEWSAAFANDPALNQRFGEVKVTEPVGEILRTALRGFVTKHKFPAIDASILELVIRLSSEYNAEGAQPRKGTLLIEEIFADQELKGDLRSPTIEDVKASAQRLYSLHQDHFDRDKMRGRVAGLNDVLSKKVIGQPLAKQALAQSFGTAIAGVEDKSKPKGRKIFAGPRGQGKTELIKAAGEAMGLPTARIVMTTYTNPGQTDELKRTIAQALRKNGNSILFFDEIEKAHPSIQKDLLDLLDSGRFSVQERTGSSSSVTLELNVRNAYVYMATNAGASYIDALKDKSGYKLSEMREAMHRDGLNDLVLDRMDGVIPFFYLTADEYRKVIVVQIRNILNVFKENHPESKLTLDNLRGFIDQTVKDTYREKMSNREALTALSEQMRVRIAEVVNQTDDLSRVAVPLGGDRTNPHLRPGTACRLLFGN